MLDPEKRCKAKCRNGTRCGFFRLAAGFCRMHQRMAERGKRVEIFESPGMAGSNEEGRHPAAGDGEVVHPSPSSPRSVARVVAELEKHRQKVVALEHELAAAQERELAGV